MKKILLVIVISLLTVSIAYCQEQPLQLTIKSDKEVYEVGEKGISKDEAITIAKKAMKESNINIDEYYLESVKEIQWNNQDKWLITYDLKKKLQQKSQGLPVTLGDEIFIKVDKKSREVIITYGE
ncbi:MAG: hypothetical protein JSV93_02640 [Candidatus Omnitrophota bacterium]|nr:MAG: hypothetical protein JSV93_02640 [Candidatus Omnitrophota bacterium]